MIRHSSFPAEPWAVRETGLDLSVLAQSESIFALSNGHIGLRAVTGDRGSGRLRGRRSWVPGGRRSPSASTSSPRRSTTGWGWRS
jgi:hypothetical protein